MKNRQHKKIKPKAIKFQAIMKWVEPNQQWFMYNANNDKFIMNFFDCENITRLFPHMKKNKANTYELNIKEIEHFFS